MRYVKHTSLLLIVVASLLVLAGCGQAANCNGITFGGSGSGSGGGGLNGPGSVCGPGSNGGGGGGGATDILYYLGGGTVIDAANLTSSTFANVVGYTPVGFANGTQLGENFWIVNKKYLYVPTTAPTGGGVLAYAITRATAALTPLTSSPFATSTINADIAVSDPQERFLFVSDTISASIAVFKIDLTTGSLTASGSPASTGGAPNHLLVDGTGTYLYFPNGGMVYGFSIDQTSGALTPLFNSPFNLPMTSLQADPTGQFLLGVTGSSGDNNVYVIPIGAGTGTLGVPTAVATVSVPQNLALSPNGKFLFTFAVNTTNQPLPIEGFTFDATMGTLTAMANSPFLTLPKVAAGQFDQNGTALIGLTVTSFTAYSIDAVTGAPTSPTPSLGVAHDERFAVTN